MTVKRKKPKPKIGKSIIAIDHCKECGTTIYTRSRMLNRAMVRFLIALYRHHRDKSWSHAVDLSHKPGGDGILAAREYQRLVHWKLIERNPIMKADGNPYAGYYRITDLGIDFVESRVSIWPRIVMRNTRFMGYDKRPGIGDKKITIHHALKEQFDYRRDIRDEP